MYGFCRYCGCHTPNITQDHIIPKSCLKVLQYRYRDKQGIRTPTLNDNRNLIPSCYYCNQKKGSTIKIITPKFLNNVHWFYDEEKSFLEYLYEYRTVLQFCIGIDIQYWESTGQIVKCDLWREI